MPTLDFALTWDYRCPFAWKANDHVVTGLEAGAAWNVSFVPFSLGQVHVGEGEPDIWDRPDDDTGLFALQTGTVVRDRHPEAFPGVHRALFEIRHRHGGDLRDREAIEKVLIDHDLDADEVFAEVDRGDALQTIKREHTAYATSHAVWGVPTFIAGDQAVFVRLMNSPNQNADESIAAVERILDLLTGWVDLNEFKHTSIPR
jgi:hypothetical protein